MRKFTFRLQVVLDRALKEEEDQQLLLVKVRQELAEKASEIYRLIEMRQQLKELTDRLQEGKFDPREVHGCYQQLDRMTVELESLRSEYAAINERVLAQQQVVVETMRKRQTLERLCEKQREEYRLKLERTELREVEDAVLPRLAREKLIERARIHSQQHP